MKNLEKEVDVPEEITLESTPKIKLMDFRGKNLTHLPKAVFQEIEIEEQFAPGKTKLIN